MPPPASLKNDDPKQTEKKLDPEDQSRPPRKRARVLGTFACPDCDKVFTRSDHLSRHYLNHKPKEVFECDYLVHEVDGTSRKCGRTFVRRDLKERHMKRHDDDSTKGNRRSIGNAKHITPISAESAANSTTSDHQFLQDDQLLRQKLKRSLLLPRGSLSSLSATSPHKDFNTKLLNRPLDTLQPAEALLGHHSVQNPDQQHVHFDLHKLQAGADRPFPSTSQGHQIPNQQQNDIITGGLLPSIGLQPSLSHLELLNHFLNKGANFNFAGMGGTHSQNDIILWLFTDSPPNSLLRQQQTFNSEQMKMPVFDGREQLNMSPENPLLSIQYPSDPPSLATSIPGNSPLPMAHLSGNIANNNVNDTNNNANSSNGNNTNPKTNDNNANDANPSPSTLNIQNSNTHIPASINNLGDNSGMAGQNLNQALTNANANLIQNSNNSININNNRVSGSAGPPLALLIPITSQLVHELSPFFHNRQLDQQLYNAYGLADANVFSNLGNPLEEIFLKLIPDNKTVPNLLLGNMTNFNVASTALLSSPAISTDSASTPNEEKLKRDAILVQERLGDFVKKLNVQKNKHIYIDNVIVDACMGSLQTISRENIMNIFEDDGETSLFISFEDRLLYYLHLYWTVFHPQFSMLHKPSFDTKNCEPLLILALILVGSQYLEFPKQSRRMSAEFKLAIKIATPLRFMIFQHEDFKLPVRLWVLQALTTLEWVEKNFLLRDMHERAHVHHGTTAQLLRRLPLLGGNPAGKSRKRNGFTSTSGGEDESDLQGDVSKSGMSNGSEDQNSDGSLFAKWVDSELMKRVTFMAFYIDVMDYIKFRHNPQILFVQMQLLHLPCNDENLWELTEVNGLFKKVVKRQKKLQHQLNSNVRFTGIKPGDSFLSALKKLIKRSGDHLPKTGVLLFTRKVLFAGLVLLMYQIQQQELQNSLALLIEKQDKSAQWKEILTIAFDNCNHKIIEGCCMKATKLGKLLLPPKFLPLQCQFPIYHLTQIIGLLDLNHYDLAIFGGLPANMSVSATTKDHIIVQAKLNSMWLRYAVQKKRTINDIINLKSVIHLLLLLWETVLAPPSVEGVTPAANAVSGSIPLHLLLLLLLLLQHNLPNGHPRNQDFLDWHLEPDYFDLMYAIAVATLTLWLFVFTTCGLELQTYIDRLERCENYNDLIEYLKENGHAYLHRIRLEFWKYLNNEGFGLNYLVQPFNGKIPPHEVQLKYIEMLPRLTDKQNISGICFLVGTKLLNSQWEILRENAKLILNCGLRSIGKKTIICENLFDNEWD